MENLKLKTTWTFWENIATQPMKSQKEDAWKESILEVISFSDLNYFAQIWSALPHISPAVSFFYDKARNVTKKV